MARGPDALDNWKTQLRKGFLDLCILNFLARRPYYGYDLVQELKTIEGTAMREGIVYPILARLQADGLVESETRPSDSGPPRKYYAATREGRACLKEMNSHWKVMTAAMVNATSQKETRRHAG